ncbi:tRNA (guanosine(46)-N7)-methyltransferase TrmB [Candidatus Synechococcus calcipolaris G9]|uniref:tRNA (guanine-N(7)-)-methyltransferase n=1 Tax=Candidatus Synechococcus calcipolaris G9 TaxID=1497997 RepID=A0ABT6F2W2_9SYNE|nr:tRNA (guanosine(46)-N7)-methyltransferase TrmB [Candidatus Synechococcus calcipolaris]MDG2992211.1 tRNA (guanosine(46)-N7)-methyltransferase TrmB [Candidatus Synechococcus calcipolaris G9]
MAKPVRVRQHVNPLSHKFQQPPQAAEGLHYSNPEQPLHLDIGAARGTFLLEMALAHPDWNFLGLEIRQPLVLEANARRDRLRQDFCQDSYQHSPIPHALENLHYLWGNANRGLEPLLAPFPLRVITIQFPDPWFKRRHHKRRLVQPELVQTLVNCLEPGGWIFMQTDIFQLAVEMGDRLGDHPDLILDSPRWLPASPFPVATEREKSVLSQGLPIYRSRFFRKKV